jgi:CRP/FNR family transcriptional regulator
VIYHQGELGIALFFLIRGKVELAVQAADGREVGLAVLGPGALFGELALTKAARFVTARAVTDVEVGLVSADQVKLELSHDPALFDEILSLMGERLRTAAETVTQLLSAPLAARLARWLLELAVEDPLSGSLHVEMTQEELATFVGGSREAVNRELGRLAGRGCLSLRRGRIQIHRPEDLEGPAGAVQDRRPLVGSGPPPTMPQCVHRPQLPSASRAGSSGPTPTPRGTGTTWPPSG